MAVGACALAACDGGNGSDEGQGETRETPAPSPTSSPVASFAPPGPAEFHIIAGAVERSFDIEAFMPETIVIRAGDRIRWTSEGYEGHTVTFLAGRDMLPGSGYLVPDPEDPSRTMFNPDFALPHKPAEVYAGKGYFNSGFIGIPQPGEFELEFSRPGTYPYLCMVHPLHMHGVVVVAEPDAPVPSPEAVEAQGQEDLATHVREAEELLADAQERFQPVGPPDGPQTWRVNVGLVTPRVQITQFVSNDFEIAAGDTVIFQNDERNFHNVIFNAGRKPPDFVLVRASADGRGLDIILNPESVEPVDPPPGFDDKTYISSGMMGVTNPRMTYALTFEKPGTYIFHCTIHTNAGMSGVLKVKPRDGG